MSIPIILTPHTAEFLLAHPDGLVDRLDIDPVRFDMMIKDFYKEAFLEKQSSTPVSLSFYVDSAHVYSSEEVFRTKGVEQQKAVGELLKKRGVIEKYKVEISEQRMHLKNEWHSKMVVDANISSILLTLWFVPSKFIAFTEERFAFCKDFFQQVSQVYSQLIKIIEAHFTEPVEYNEKLDRYYKALVGKLKEHFQSNIRATLFQELTIPFNSLLMHQADVVNIAKDIKQITSPMQDNLAGLQRLLDLYTLKRHEPDFQRLDQFLSEVMNNKKQGVLLPNGLSKTATHSAITKITIVRTATDSSIKIVVNNEYDKKPIKASLHKGPWKLLLRLAENERPVYSHNLQSPMDYLNSNTACKLYTNTGKERTTIVEKVDNRIVPAVDMEIISSQAYQQRKNKLKFT